MKSSYTDKIIAQALHEDAAHNDITTQYFVPKNKISKSYIIVKEEAVVCGLNIARQVFKKIDQNCTFTTRLKDGALVKKGTRIAHVTGKTRALLSGERTALNFLAHLSGIATETKRFVKRVHPYKTKILDTRKTIPGLRELEKYAVRCGRGVNHRENLNEMILIKDNHLNAYGNIHDLPSDIKKIKEKTRTPIEIEVENLSQLKVVLKACPDYILLDNMSTSQLREAVKIVKRTFLKNRPLLEASGGITLANVHAIAQTGVDRISVGALTHSAKAINFSMEILNG